MITQNQQTGLLQAVYEFGTRHMRLVDYMNSTMVSWDWREALYTVGRVARLQHVYRISTPLFNRFIDEASRIDQSDNPKFYEVREQGANNLNPMLVTYRVPLSQEDYEVRKLKSARTLAMGNAYSNDEHNKLLSFEGMSND